MNTTKTELLKALKTIHRYSTHKSKLAVSLGNELYDLGGETEDSPVTLAREHYEDLEALTYLALAELQGKHTLISVT